MVGTAYTKYMPLRNSTRATRIRRPISDICNRITLTSYLRHLPLQFWHQTLQTYKSHGGLSKTGVEVDMATLTLNLGLGQNFEGAKRLTKIREICTDYGCKKSHYVKENEKTIWLRGQKCRLHAKFREKSTQRPPKFINVLNGLKSNEADKMAQWELYHWNCRSRFVYIRKNFNLLAQLHHIVYSGKSKYRGFVIAKICEVMIMYSKRGRQASFWIHAKLIKEPHCFICYT